MYTAIDYCKIMEHLIQRWKVADLRGLTPRAAEAQDFVCSLPPRILRLAERKTGACVRGSWVGLPMEMCGFKDVVAVAQPSTALPLLVNDAQCPCCLPRCCRAQGQSQEARSQVQLAARALPDHLKQLALAPLIRSSFDSQHSARL